MRPLRSQQSVSNQDILDEMRNGFKSVNERIDSYQEHVNTKITTIENRISDIEHEQKRMQKENNLAISGIPYIMNEKVYDIFLQIAKIINFNEVQTMVNIFRSGKKQISGQEENTSPIVVQFANKFAKASFHHQYLTYLRSNQLLLSNIGIDSNKRFFINEQLTAKSYNLLKSAKRLVKEMKIIKAFSRHGLIYILPSSTNKKPCLINSIADLDKYQ